MTYLNFASSVENTGIVCMFASKSVIIGSNHRRNFTKKTWF